MDESKKQKVTELFYIVPVIFSVMTGTATFLRRMDIIIIDRVNIFVSDYFLKGISYFLEPCRIQSQYEIFGDSRRRC